MLFQIILQPNFLCVHLHAINCLILKQNLRTVLRLLLLPQVVKLKFHGQPKARLMANLFNNEVFGRRYMEYMETKNVKVPNYVEVGASTDMGNISYVVPTLHPIFSIDTDAYNHTVGFTRAAGTSEAHKRTLIAASCLSMTAVDASLDSAFFEKAVESFEKGKPQ
ncbi:hypothetical protein G6F56_013201 [Rhizopus delemar]|nr:hypothetical protein G6F56_013201 [Rhizopus delemar]